MVQLYISRYNYILNDVNSIEDLVEKTESHVIVFLLFLGLRFLSSCGSRSSSSCSSRGSGSTSSTSSGHRAKLARSLGNQLLNVLAGKLSDNLVNLGVIGLDTNRAKVIRLGNYHEKTDDIPEDALDVGSGGFSTTEGGEEGSSNVTHD